jgi:hypothetical protein
MTAGPTSIARARARRAMADDVAVIPTIGVAEIWAAPSRIEPVIPVIDACVGRPTIVYGPPAAGKSIMLGAIAIAASAGVSILGAPPREPMRVLWLDAEVGGPLTCARTQRLARGMGVGPDAIGDRLRIAIYPALALDDGDAEQILTAMCAGYTLMIIDSLTAMSGSTDETTPEMGRVLIMLARVSGRTDCAIVVIHHSRRDGEIRGSTSIAAGSECIWRMSARGRETVLRHERSPIGALRDDLAIRIVDVEMDGDPLAGLAVERGDDAASATTRTLAAEIIDYLVDHGPHRGGADTLATRMGRRADLVRDAVRALVDARTLARSGRGSATTIEVTR